VRQTEHRLPPSRPRRLSGRTAALLVAGILALAFNLRAAITSLPPVFPELQGSLHISASTEAALAAAPVLCFGVFSGLGAPLSRRFGEERVLGAALVLLAGGLLLRGADPGGGLFPGTVAASAAIALMNVLLPSLVKRRRPEQAGLLIGLYLLALSAGAIVGSLIAVPVFTAAGGGRAGSSAALGLWALPALLAAAAWLPQLRYRTRPPDLPPGRPGGASGPPGALTMARYRLGWQVMLFMGLQSLTYYAALSWLPSMFRDYGISAVHAGDLIALMNLGNAFSALAVPVLAHRVRDQRALIAAAMAATVIGLAGAAFGPVAAEIPFVFVLGLGQGATLGLGIYFTMARAPEPAAAASLSAFAQGGGYLIAAAGPLLTGYLHAVSGGWAVPMWALLTICLAQLTAGWLAGRDLTVPVPGPASPAAPSAPPGRA
jgi:MFS transporter, CP family, cyanate transporter